MSNHEKIVHAIYEELSQWVHPSMYEIVKKTLNERAESLATKIEKITLPSDESNDQSDLDALQDKARHGGFMLPAGTYYVGDPCYGISDDKWDQFCDEHEKGVVVIDGLPSVGLSTQYGDGVYYDGDCRDYSVDAGLLGAVDIRLAKNVGHAERLMHKTIFEEPFECYESEGVVRIGHIRIDTTMDYPMCYGAV